MHKRLVLTAALIFIAAVAHAQTDEESPFDANVRKGLEAYKDRRYTAAIKHFRDAYAVKPDPTLIFNMAKSYERLGKIEDAISHYQTYVDAPGTTAEDRADALQRIKALKQEQAARDAAARAGEPPPPQLPPEAGTERPPPPKAVELPPPARTEAPKTSPPVKTTGPIVFVVHKSNAIAALTKEQVRDIYLGRMSVWPAGGRIKPFARQRASQASTVFFGPATGIDAGQYLQHWQQKQLSGSGMAPMAVETVAALIKLVAANEGSVGYLLPNELPANIDGVRIVELK